MKKFRRIVAATLVASTLSLAPSFVQPAHADCIEEFSAEIWSLPPELIVWWFYWSQPIYFMWVMDMFHPANEQEFLMYLVNLYCTGG